MVVASRLTVHKLERLISGKLAHRNVVLWSGAIERTFAAMSGIPQSADPNLNDINLHVKPGKERAPFFRYIRINLPRLTRVLIVALMALQAVLAFYVARTDFDIFPGQELVLYTIVSLDALFVVMGAVTRWRVWDFGLIPAVGAVVNFIGAIAGTPPWVWNGADIHLAAAWNTTAFCGIAYVLLYWAMNYGVIAAYPDDQGFED